MKKYLEGGLNIIFYILLIGLFAKGEIFRVKASWISFTFTSVKNLALLFIVWWIVLSFFQKKKPYMSLWFGLALVGAILSTIVSINTTTSLRSLFILFVYAGWFYGMRILLRDSQKTLHFIIFFLSIGLMINLANLWFHSMVGINNIIEGYPFWKGKNALGLFLVFNLCVCGSLLRKIENTKWLWLLALNMILLIIGIIFSYSRGAWIAGVVALLGVICCKYKKMIWILLGSFILLGIFSPPLVSQRMKSIFDVNEINVHSRIHLWQQSIGIVKKHLLMGTGLGTFTQAYHEEYPNTVPLKGEASRLIRHAHNLYLQILVETGILGLGICLLLIFIGLIRGIRKILQISGDNQGKAIIYGSFLSIICFLVYSLFDCTLSWQFIGDSFSHINLILLSFWAIVLIPSEQNTGNIKTVDTYA